MLDDSEKAVRKKISEDDFQCLYFRAPFFSYSIVEWVWNIIIVSELDGFVFVSSLNSSADMLQVWLVVWA